MEMALDIESKIIDLVAAVARIEQKLDSHISVDQIWYDSFEKKKDRSITWWQVGITTVLSSGAIVWLLNFIFRKSNV